MSAEGSALVAEHLLKQGVVIDANNIATIDGEQYLMVISTKQHYKLKQSEVECQGFNVERVARLEQTAADNNLKGVYCIFVDIKLGQCYGAMLSYLRGKRNWCGVEWPFVGAATGGGLIEYYPIHKMPTLFHLTDEFRERMRKLAFENKHDKNQTSLL